MIKPLYGPYLNWGLTLCAGFISSRFSHALVICVHLYFYINVYLCLYVQLVNASWRVFIPRLLFCKISHIHQMYFISSGYLHLIIKLQAKLNVIKLRWICNTVIKWHFAWQVFDCFRFWITFKLISSLYWSKKKSLTKYW